MRILLEQLVQFHKRIKGCSVISHHHKVIGLKKLVVFLYLKDVGGSRTAIPRLSDTATAHFRALSPPFPAERHSHRIYCVALYIPGRCEITDMDRCTQNILSRCFCCPVHLLYSFEPAPEF